LFKKLTNNFEIVIASSHFKTTISV